MNFDIKKKKNIEFIEKVSFVLKVYTQIKYHFLADISRF